MIAIKINRHDLTKKISKIAGGKSSIHYRLFVLMVILLILLIAATLTIMSLSGVMSFYANQSRSIVESELVHLQDDITAQFDEWSAETVHMSRHLTEQMQSWVSSKGATLHELNDHPEMITGVLNEIYDTCMLELYRSNCSNVFVILDMTMNPSSANVETQKVGLQIKHLDPNMINETMTNYLLMRGPSDLAFDNGMLLSSDWSMEFSIEDADYYSLTMQAAATGNYELNDLYYWCGPPANAQGGTQDIMICCIPILDELGEPIGVCGFQIDRMQYASTFYPSALSYDSIFSVFTIDDSEQIMLDGSFTSGTFAPSSNAILTREVSKKGYVTYTESSTLGLVQYIGYETQLSLHSSDAPYSSDPWLIAVLVPKKLLTQTTLNFHLKIMALFVIMFVIGTIISLYSSKRWSAPLIQGLDAIKSNELPQEKYNIRELDEVLAYLSEHRDELDYGADQQDYNLDLIDEFLASIKTLSQAERAVFDLYVKGYTATEIAEELFLSINTIKTHNKRIYAKLNISSREELVLFVKLLRDTGNKFGE